MGVAGAAVSSAERAPRIWPSCAPTWGAERVTLAWPHRHRASHAVRTPRTHGVGHTIAIVSALEACPSRTQACKHASLVVAQISCTSPSASAHTCAPSSTSTSHVDHRAYAERLAPLLAYRMATRHLCECNRTELLRCFDFCEAVHPTGRSTSWCCRWRLHPEAVRLPPGAVRLLPGVGRLSCRAAPGVQHVHRFDTVLLTPRVGA